MTLRTSRAAVLFVLLAACKQDHPQCERFVDLAMRCDLDMRSVADGEAKQARSMMDGMCEEAFRNDTRTMSGDAKQMVTDMYAELRDRADCTAHANTCDQYSKCTETN